MLNLQTIDFSKIDELPASQVEELLSLMQPKLNKYIPHVPTVKQAIFMNLTVREAFFGGAAGGGKDIALDTPIYTPEGWKEMRDIHPGDYVYGRDGNPIKVLAESEVFNHDCYEVEFDNGEVIVAGAHHIWSVVSANRMQRYKLTKNPHDATGAHMQNKTTEELSRDLYCDSVSKTSKYRVPVGHPLECMDIDLPIDPYVLGFWLGDGTTEDGTITTQDVEAVEQIAKRRPIHKAYKSSTIQYRVDGLRQDLKACGLLGNKHIPRAYMMASREDKLDLLRGLMDSDGTIDARGVMNFCSTDEKLILDVVTLLGTLGIKAGISRIKNTGIGNYDIEYRVNFSTTERVFYLPRKAERQKAELKGVENWFYIRDVRKVKSVPTKCIKVEAEDGLFRVGHSMILTHNSDALLMDALQNVDKKGYAAILFRRTYADLTKPGALMDRAKEWLLRHPDVRWVDRERRFEFLDANREVISILQFGYLENSNDKYNYQGGEYQYIGFDEVTHIQEDSYKYMFSRLRRLKGSDIPLKVRAASNPPDDDQGLWVYDRFVNPKTRRKGAIFIPAGLDDNPYLDREEYERSLEELDPVTRARLRDGNWEVRRKGNMFKREWFEFVDAPPVNRRRVRFWDMAATEEKKGKDPDYTVGFLMSEAEGVFYIEDIIRERLRPKDTEELQRMTAIADGYSTRIREEMEPGSSGLAVIDLKSRTLFRGYDYNGVRSTGSKVVRANALSAAAERGHVKIVRGCRNVEEFLAEAEAFPGGVHDDTVDGASGAFTALRDMPTATIPIEIGGYSPSYWSTVAAEDYEIRIGDKVVELGSGSYWSGI